MAHPLHGAAMMMIMMMMASFSTVAKAWAPAVSQHRLAVVFHPRDAISVASISKTHRTLLASSTTSTSTSTSDNFGNLISLQDSLELFQNNDKDITDENVIFVDGSFYHKGNRNGRQEFEAGPRIQGAKYMDMNDIATSQELYPDLNPKGLYHMLPPPNLFAAAMDAFGIRNSDRVIVYGREGSIFTPRTWFLFRSMGHQKVHLMQASLEEWTDAGGLVDKTPTTVIHAKDLDLSTPPNYQAQTPEDVCSMDDMLNFVEASDSVILDPRGSSFAKGFIPGAKHIPYSSLVTPENQLKLKSKDELKVIFETAGVDIHTEQRIVCSCGSGVSVCHLYLALQECGRTGETLIYDGSWNEWKQNPDAPKVIPSEASKT